MKVLSGPFETWAVDQPTGIAIGVFDGVHRGHRHVVSLLRDGCRLRGLVPAVLTFDPHPLMLVAPDRAPARLTTIEQRLEQFESTGVGVAAVLEFTDDVRSMDPARFVDEVLVRRLAGRFVVAGEDFRFGSDRAGDVELLRTRGAAAGFDVEAMPLVGDDQPISSTVIRATVAAGDVERAAQLLGRPYELPVRSLPGDSSGGVVSTPVEVPSRMAVPAAGVYRGVVNGRPAAVVVADGEIRVVTEGDVSGGRAAFLGRLDGSWSDDAELLARATS